jgi:PLAT/LH2 domain-containing protein
MTRPFYLVGHNTNSLAAVRLGLRSGLNAFEIDVNKDARGRLFVSHGAVPPTVALFGPPVPLTDFLDEFAALAPRIALLIWDCKIEDPALAVRLRDETRKRFSDGGDGTAVVYSVPYVDRARQFFRDIRTGLTAREGLMVDQEKDATRVARCFREMGVVNACYGNGVTTIPGVGVGLPSPSLPSEFDTAVAVEALDGLAFTYPWVIAQAETMREFVGIGVDGMIVDVADAGTLVDVVARSGGAVRPAVPGDGPFAVGGSPLVLEVVTGDVPNAGTDATVTFTVERSAREPVTKVFDGARVGRLERGTSTWVTLRDADVASADVVAIKVRHDGGHLSSEWFLDSIAVHQRGAAKRTCTFGKWVKDGKPARAKCV